MALKLNKREKYAVYAASGFICLFVLMQWVVFPFIDNRQRLTRMLQVKTSVLEDMGTLKSDYEAIKKEVDLSKVRYAKRQQRFTLFSFLDKLAGETGIKDHITYMKPSTSTQKDSRYKISLVEMKFQGVTLEQLTLYLHRVETSENMASLKRISITREGKKDGYINVVLQVEALDI